MIWLIDTEANLDALNAAIHADLLAADLRTYPQSTVAFSVKRFHPSSGLVAMKFPIGKVIEWDVHILAHINENDLVDLTSDWEVPLP